MRSSSDLRELAFDRAGELIEAASQVAVETTEPEKPGGAEFFKSTCASGTPGRWASKLACERFAHGDAAEVLYREFIDCLRPVPPRSTWRGSPATASG